MNIAKSVNPSWEHPKNKNEVHSPEGIEQLKESLKYALTKVYSGIAENMWRYDGLDDEQLKDFQVMSRDTEPEKTLLQNGKLVEFKYGNQLHFLPMVENTEGINIYGYPSYWHPVPKGWTEINHPNNTIWSDFTSMRLNETDSVVWRNDMFGTGDEDFIDKMVNLLIDNILTTNQLQLIMSMPFCFYTDSENLTTAKQFFLDIANHRPSIYINKYGDKPAPIIEKYDVKLDPSLFELYDRWETTLLNGLGIPARAYEKRAQQSVSEVNSDDDKVTIKRKEKLRMREQACQRSNEIFGTHLSVVSVIDEMEEQKQQDAMELAEKSNEGDDNGTD